MQMGKQVEASARGKSQMGSCSHQMLQKYITERHMDAKDASQLEEIPLTRFQVAM